SSAASWRSPRSTWGPRSAAEAPPAAPGAICTEPLHRSQVPVLDNDDHQSHRSEGPTMSPVRVRRRTTGLIAAAAATILALTACADTEDIDGGGDGDGGGGIITVGTTDTVFNLDPAGAYDNGSLAVFVQVYPF